jgi:hypothetical protein
MRRLMPRPSYANVMATIAVFIALGGVSYAATDVASAPTGTTWDGSTYRVTAMVFNNSPGESTTQGVWCHRGDRALGGGWSFSLDPGTIVQSLPVKEAGNVPHLRQGWSVAWENSKPNKAVEVTVSVRCANFQVL